MTTCSKCYRKSGASRPLALPVAQGPAAYITASADPLGTVASVRRLLLAELDAIEKSASTGG